MGHYIESAIFHVSLPPVHIRTDEVGASDKLLVKATAAVISTGSEGVRLS